MAVTVNGVGAISGTIEMPLLGAWNADLIVNADTAPVGAVTISSDGGLTLVGFVIAGGAFEETAYVRIMGGAGGLSRPALARHYRSATMQTVLVDLMRASGERLSGTADAAVTGLPLPAWTQRANVVGLALGALVSNRRLAPPAAWRVLPDGSIWVGRETWPDAGLTAPQDYQEITDAPSEGWVELGFEEPRLTPGVSLEGRHLSYIQHRIYSDAIRTRAWVE